MRNLTFKAAMLNDSRTTVNRQSTDGQSQRHYKQTPLSKRWKVLMTLVFLFTFAIGNVWAADVVINLQGTTAAASKKAAQVGTSDAYFGRCGNAISLASDGLAIGNSTIFVAFRVAEKSEIVLTCYCTTSSNYTKEEYLSTVTWSNITNMVTTEVNSTPAKAYFETNYETFNITYNRDTQKNKEYEISLGEYAAGDYAIYMKNSINSAFYIRKITLKPSCTAPTTAFSEGAYTVGESALALSSLIVENSNNSDGAISYVVKTDGGTGASIAAGSFTATTAGTATITATQAADATHNKCEKIIDFNVVVTASSCAATIPGDISKGALTAGEITLTADGSAESGDIWYWQDAADGTATNLGTGATKNINTAGMYYIRSYNTAGDCWSAAKSIELTAEDFLATPTMTFDDGAYVVGASALNLSTLFESQNTSAVSFALKVASEDATVSGSNFTATKAGSYVVVATQAADATYKAVSEEATITVTYPATGSATVTYKIAVGTSQTTLGTASKEDNSASISGLSDFAFAGGLDVLSGGGKDVSSPKIANPTAKDENKYLYFTFNVADGYEFVISSVSTKVVAVSNVKTIEVALSDTEGTSESLSYDQAKNSDPAEHVFDFAGKAYSGTVTLKIYAYAATEEGYRLGQPLTISGTVQAAAQKYNVSFAKGGADGSETMDAAEYKAGATVTAPACAFTYTDHIFDGWAVTGVAGVTSVAAGGTFTMPGNPVTLTATWRADEGEARIGETNYPTLAEAVAYANAHAGSEIVLLKDVDVTAQIEISANTILDLNGHTIEYVGDATLPSGVILVHNGASLTINDSSNSDAGSVVSGDKAYAAVALTKLGDDASNSAILVVNGGTLTGHYYGITGNGSRNNTVITINGGTITGTVGTAIYNPQVGTLTVNNGTLTGLDAAIEMRAGTLAIIDGTFTATATGFSCISNGSGSTTTGAAIAIAQHSTQQNISVTINGGTFNGVKAISEANPQNNPAPQVTMAVTNGEFNGEVTTVDVNSFISGGKFSEVVAVENCAEGFVPVTEKDANNQYAVTPGCKIYLNTNGGNEIAATFAATGANMPSVESPVKAGNVFKGWFAEAGLENAYVPGAVVTSEADVTLYAKWEAAEPNHYVYAYNDAFHYDGVTYLTPIGKVDNAADDNKGIAYTLFEGEEGITSVVLTNGSYDCKTGALQAITSHLKLKNDASSKLTVTIKSGYTATLKIKAAGYGGARNYAVSNAEPAIATTEGKLVNDNAMNLSSLVEQTFALEAGVHEITANGGTLYISEMDIEAAEVTVDLTLKDLKVGGTSIEGFAASTTRYEYNLAYGEAYPEVTYVLNDVVDPELVEVAVAQLADRINIDQSALVKVTEKANTENFKQYQVHFNIAAKEGVCLVKGNVTDNAITRDAEASYLKAEQVTLANSKVSGRDEEGDTGSKFQKKSYLKIELPEGESFQIGDIVDLEVSKIGGTYKLLVYAAYDGGDAVEAGENLLVNAETAPTLAVGHNKVALTKASRTLYLARDNSNSWNPHVLSVSVQRYMDPFIKEFKIGEAVGTIDQVNKTIAVEVPATADLEHLTPTIKAYANGGATLDKTGEQDFSGSVTYTVSSAYAEDGDVTYTVTVTKAAAIDRVEISGTLSVLEGETTTLSAAVYDTNDELASIQAVVWTVKSGDESLAEVSATGVVTAKAVGTAHIIATSVADDTKSAQVEVTVSENPCRVWNAPATSWSDAIVTIGKFQIKRGDCPASSSVTPYSGASSVYGIKVDGNAKFIELTMSDGSQFESLTLGVTSGSNGSSPKYALVASSAVTFNTSSVLSVAEYAANAKDAAQALNDIDLPTGTRNVRIYRIYEGKGDGTSVYLYYANACKKELVPLTSISVADMSLAVGVAGTPVVTLNPTTADVASYVWSIESDETGVATIDDATGVLSSAVAGAVTVKVTATDAFSNVRESNVATINIVNKYVDVVPVSETTTWSWSGKATADVIITGVDTVLANYFGGAEWLKIAGKAANDQYAYRSSSYDCYQGTYLYLNATVPGMLVINTRYASSGAKLSVNGHEIAPLTDQYTEYKVAVPAGNVKIEATGNQKMRIKTMKFDTDFSKYAVTNNRFNGYTRDVTEGRYGTICLPNGGVMVGATLYEVAYYGQTSKKIFFDEILNGTMEAGVPYIFLPKEGASQLAVYYTDEANESAKNANGLHGFIGANADAEMNVPVGAYILNANQYREVVTLGTAKIKSNRSYIVLEDINPSEPALAPGRRRISMSVYSEQVATGIENTGFESEAPRKVLINGELYIIRGEKMYDAKGQLVK